jgi:DNA invertase Pin-like site-specific DNA recombinase
MRAIGYSRVSTDLQAAEGVSMEAQAERIRAWCAANGAELAEADLFADSGLSGKRADNRPGLQAALDAATAGRGCVLVVYSLSRLARSTRDTIAIAERLEKAGADLVSLSERIDTTSAAGKMLFRLLAVLAEFERDLVSERTRGAVAYKRSRGERLGRIPYGADLADDGKTLLPNTDELRVVEFVRAWRAEGRSLRAIADELTALGIKTKSGSTRWSHTSIVRLLERRPDAA